MFLVVVGYLDGILVIYDLVMQIFRYQCQYQLGIVQLLWEVGIVVVYICSLDGIVCFWDVWIGCLFIDYWGYMVEILDFVFSKDVFLVVIMLGDYKVKVFCV